jgi:hypothetical protein
MRICGMAHGIVGAGRAIRLMAVLSMLAIVLTGCPGSTTDRLSSESLQLKAEMDAYVINGNRVDAAIAAGRATRAQFDRFTAATAEVRAADDLVQGDLSVWRRTSVEPGTYVANVAALRHAQRKVAQLAQEVQ